jgi:transcriptional regulator
MPKSPIPKKKPKVRKTKRGRPKKLSAIELAERRQAVLTLRLKGMTYKNIAKEVGVGYMTVKRDLDQIRQENVQQVSKFNRDVAIGQAIASYNQVEVEAWQQYHKCSNGTNQKANFLHLVRAATNDRVKLLTEVGLVSKAAVRVEHKVEADAVLKGWTQDAKQLVAMAIIRAQMQDGSNGKGDILDLPPEAVEQKQITEGKGGNGA